MENTDAMFEAGVACTWVDVPGETQLSNSAKTLKKRRINDYRLPALQPHRSPNCIVDDLGTPGAGLSYS